MSCILPSVVQLRYILRHVKHLKCESGNNATEQWRIWTTTTTKPFPSCLTSTCTTFPTGVLYWMSEAWVWRYIPGETPRVSKFLKKKEKKSQLQLDIFSAFSCAPFLWPAPPRVEDVCVVLKTRSAKRSDFLKKRGGTGATARRGIYRCDRKNTDGERGG